ncbi:MAG: HlyD family efflux transporter periplasmic adaptor subunit [Eubacterium sp.]|nr:HlyD family efflux transporter periplasmic adaptor subunit [Eubacterium sp.]
MSEKRRKKKISKGKLAKIIVITTVVLGLVIFGIIILKKKVGETYGNTNQAEVLTATVEKNGISTTVSGSGQLSDDDVETIEVPENVEIEEYMVSTGDTVKEGDVLAKVNTRSVITAMAVLQSDIDALDEKLEEASDAEISSKIKANISGRVKKIYAAEDDKVIAVMNENNALMVISADGYMAVQLEGTSLKEGDEVTVTASDDTEISGKVKFVSGTTATILFSDESTAIGAKVTVKDSSGNTVGSGTCEVNSPVTVVGYGGTVESIEVSENSKVSEGTTLLTLTDTEDTIDFETLLKQRKTLEETLADLMAIYKKGAICATVSGSVKKVPGSNTGSSSSDSSENVAAGSTKASTGSSSKSSSPSPSTGSSSGSGSTKSSSGSSKSSAGSSASTGSSTAGEDESGAFTISPDKTMTVSVSVDEKDILSLEVGQEVNVTVSSVGEDTYSGKITKINKTGTSNDGVTSYTTDVQIEKQEGMLEGMTAQASIEVESVDDALVIPVAALNETSSTAYVYSTYDEETGELGGMKEVTVGISNSNYVEIKEGLAEGETVYYKEKTKEKNRNKNGFSMPGDGGTPGSDFGGFGGGSGGFTRPSGGQGSGRPSFPGGGN